MIGEQIESTLRRVIREELHPASGVGKLQRFTPTWLRVPKLSWTGDYFYPSALAGAPGFRYAASRLPCYSLAYPATPISRRTAP